MHNGHVIRLICYLIEQAAWRGHANAIFYWCHELCKEARPMIEDIEQ